MKKLISISILLAMAISSFALDVVVKAMQDEMQRVKHELRLDGVSRPYYTLFRIIDSDVLDFDSDNGSLTGISHETSRQLSTELRVGSAKRDNSWFIAGYGDLYNSGRGLPIENDYNALRRGLWLATDRAYKSAIEQLSRKESYFQTHPTSDTLPDLSESPVINQMSEPLDVAFDSAKWCDAVQQISSMFQQFPEITSWNTHYSANKATRRLLNSEGSVAVQYSTVQSIELSATAQSVDGERIVAHRRFYARDNDTLLSVKQLQKAAEGLAKEIVAMSLAEPLTEYSGPILFSGEASAQFLSQLFVKNLTPLQKLLSPMDYIETRYPAGKLAQRLHRRVLPDFLTVVDDPTRRDWQGRKLIGYRQVDDEAVIPQRITIVENGKLETLPSTRRPANGSRLSNGHARAAGSFPIIPLATNLFLESKQSSSEKELIDKMRAMCRESGAPYGLVVMQMLSGSIAYNYMWSDPPSEPYTLTPPMIVYKVDANSGMLTPVRGLQFDEVSIRSLRDIIAVGDTPRLQNVIQPTPFIENASVVSIVTPSILVEEMECKAYTQREQLYRSPRPVANLKK